jgi:uncharacterized Fe-S radical SAM superfamily protein PflX
MPGLLDETEAILRFVADELGRDTYVNVMAQYYPAGRTGEFPEIDRADFFDLDQARRKINAGQVPLIDELERLVRNHM